MNGAGNAALTAASRRLRWPAIAACRSAGSVASSSVKHGPKAADHLRRVGVTDDLGQGKHQQAVEVAELPLDPDCTAGVNPQAGRIQPVPVMPRRSLRRSMA